MNKFDVLVIGRSCLDYISVVNRFPEENRKTAMEFRLMEGGGQGGTASCCIAKLGGRVAYVGKLGGDPEGSFCRRRLEDFGVTTEFIETIPGGVTPVAYIFVTKTSGERTIIYEHNSLPNIKIDSTLDRLINQSNIILLDPETTYLAKELARRKMNHHRIVYDGERWHEGIEEAMKSADYFIPSSEFLNVTQLNFDVLSLNQQILLLSRMVKGELIITDGHNGAYYLMDNKIFQVRPLEIKAVDTIGAGDNFHAAFALALSKGFELTPAVKFSVAVASLSCREYGGRKGVPQWNEAVEIADKLEAVPL